MDNPVPDYCRRMPHDAFWSFAWGHYVVDTFRRGDHAVSCVMHDRKRHRQQTVVTPTDGGAAAWDRLDVPAKVRARAQRLLERYRVTP